MNFHKFSNVTHNTLKNTEKQKNLKFLKCIKYLVHKRINFKKQRLLFFILLKNNRTMLDYKSLIKLLSSFYVFRLKNKKIKLKQIFFLLKIRSYFKRHLHIDIMNFYFYSRDLLEKMIGPLFDELVSYNFLEWYKGDLLRNDLEAYCKSKNILAPIHHEKYFQKPRFEGNDAYLYFRKDALKNFRKFWYNRRWVSIRLKPVDVKKGARSKIYFQFGGLKGPISGVTAQKERKEFSNYAKILVTFGEFAHIDKCFGGVQRLHYRFSEQEQREFLQDYLRVYKDYGDIGDADVNLGRGYGKTMILKYFEYIKFLGLIKNTEESENLFADDYDVLLSNYQVIQSLKSQPFYHKLDLFYMKLKDYEASVTKFGNYKKIIRYHGSIYNLREKIENLEDLFMFENFLEVYKKYGHMLEEEYAGHEQRELMTTLLEPFEGYIHKDAFIKRFKSLATIKRQLRKNRFQFQLDLRNFLMSKKGQDCGLITMGSYKFTGILDSKQKIRPEFQERLSEIIQERKAQKTAGVAKITLQIKDYNKFSKRNIAVNYAFKNFFFSMLVLCLVSKRKPWKLSPLNSNFFLDVLIKYKSFGSFFCSNRQNLHLYYFPTSSNLFFSNNFVGANSHILKLKLISKLKNIVAVRGKCFIPAKDMNIAIYYAILCSEQRKRREKNKFFCYKSRVRIFVWGMPYCNEKLKMNVGIRSRARLPLVGTKRRKILLKQTKLHKSNKFDYKLWDKSCLLPSLYMQWLGIRSRFKK